MDRDQVYLRDIMDSAAAAQEYVRGVSRQAFLAEREKQDAVIRALEVIGEAVRRLSEETRAAIPDVAWDRFRRLRNILIHQYDNVDLDLVLDTVREDLPLLEKAIRAYLQAADK